MPRDLLAVEGGEPVRDPSRDWPIWPARTAELAANLRSVIASDRWTLTAPVGSSELFERKFAEEFAAYTGSRYCVPVDHGASALVVALDALDLEYGDRVLVPTLTWTASATAALRAGLVPLLVDVDLETGCISPANICLDSDPRAIVAVHWSCGMADIPSLIDATASHGVHVVEDCAQAHGAEWDRRRAGSMGRLGCFSMQHGKVLTSGEGGAVVTDDELLAGLLEELRADSRRFRTDRPNKGESDLVETGTTLGANFCLSEFHAAVLCAGLRRLEEQHAIRAGNFAVLAKLIGEIPGVHLVTPRPQQTKWSIFEVPILFERLRPNVTNVEVAAALTAELGRPFYLTDPPLHRSPLFQPWKKRSLAPLAKPVAAHLQSNVFPNADYLFDHIVVTHHSALLGGNRDMLDIATAIERVSSHFSER